MSSLLDAGVHPEEVAKRTEHRDVKTMFKSYFKRSNKRQENETTAVIGGIREGMWDKKSLLAGSSSVPTDIQLEEKSPIALQAFPGNVLVRADEERRMMAIRLELRR